MSAIVKAAVAAVMASLLGLTIRKNNPELSLLLGMAAALLCVRLTADILRPILAFLQELQKTAVISSDLYVPVCKCLGIGILSQIGAGICRDAGQSAAATGVELCGTAAAILCSLPLVQGILQMIGKLS